MNSIIFVHRGNPFYLSLAVEQAKKSNPNLPIILLGDESNCNSTSALHFNISDFFERASELDGVFDNHSSNPRGYELFCFQRWLIISDFLKVHPEYNDTFLYCDTDTQLYSSLNYEFKHLNENLDRIKLALVNEVSPGFTFFNGGGLDDLCKHIEWFYNTSEGKKNIVLCLEELRNSGARDGFSDMIAFRDFCRKNSSFIWNIGIPYERNGELACFDENLNSSQKSYRMTKGRMKYLIWKNECPYAYYLPYNKVVNMIGVHFQGKAKYKMIEYSKTKCTIFSSLWFAYQKLYWKNILLTNKITRYLLGR